MKKGTKIFLGAIVATVLISTTAFATIGSRTAELFYNNIKVMINGTEIMPTDANGTPVEPFIIDGTTYLPVRGVASALGMNVGWDAATNTVTLNNPGIFQGGIKVYEDSNVEIVFVGCRAPKEDDWLPYYNADFNITNKTDYTLTFQPDVLSFNGISYQVNGSEGVAPQSTGKVSFDTKDALPTNGINKISGQVSVIDFSYTFLNNSYDAKWVNITQ